MKNTVLFFLFFLLIASSVSVTGQTLLRGTVLDGETKQPIANAKFGIKNQGIGAITNEAGKFTYRKYHHVLDETSEFEISAKGYLNLIGNVDVLRKLQNKRGKIFLEKISEEKLGDTKPVDRIAVFWDASAKSSIRNPESEIAYLQEYLASTTATEIRVVIFNETIVANKHFKVSEATFSNMKQLLSGVTYQGVSDYSLLNNTTADEVLLFAENKPTFGTFQLDQSRPIHIVNSGLSTNADVYFESLATFTSGTYNNLKRTKSTEISVEEGPYVTGLVLKGEEPVPYAIISKKGDLKEYNTNAEGYFKLPASEGDKLTIYSLGNFTKTLTITSKTDYLITAVPKAEQLAAVNLKAKYKRSEYAFDSILQLDMVEGREVPIRSVHKSQFNRNAFTIGDAIDGIYGARSYYNASKGETYITVGGGCARVFVDGDEMRVASIPVHLVENISIYESYSLVLPCPSRIIVTTRMHADRIDQRLRKRGYEQLENNFYTEEVPALDAEVSDARYFPESSKFGVIRGNGTLLQGVSVLRRGTLDEVFTDADGVFAIQAAEGDILDIKHFGMYPKSIVITAKSEYSIELITKAEVLDEVQLSKKVEKPSTEYDSFDATTRMEIVNGRKYDVRKVLFKEDLNMAGADIYETVRMSDSRILVVDQEFFYSYKDLEIPLTAIVDGIPMNPSGINPLMVERVSIYLSSSQNMSTPTVMGSKIFITTRNHPDILKKFLAENDITLKNNVYEEEVSTLENTRNKYFNFQEITGTVNVKGNPLQGVSILKKGSLKEVFTNMQGFFRMEATAGDILEIRHVGMYPKTVVISDDSNYDIELINKTEILDEVAVKAKKAEEEELIATAYGKKDKKSVGYKVESELSKYVSSADVSFDQVANKLPGVIVDPSTKTLFYERGFGAISKSPIMIVLDDITVSQSTLNTIDPQTITNITALKGVVATNKYGSQAFGGVLLITTLNSGSAGKVKKPDLALNNNIYTETLPTLNFETVNADYISDVASTLSVKIKLEKYRSLKKLYMDKVDFYVDMALYFQQLDAGAAREVRNDFTLVAKDNIKALRILAYLNEHAREYIQAQKVYERILEMAPSEPQSYRDLALVYQESGEYGKALELYLNMLGNQVPGVDFSELASVLSNELQRLINLYKHKIDYQRLPNDWLIANFNIDVRMTASWSDTNAPFEFQFVNPEKRFYNWNSDNNLDKNKIKDTATEEFVIDDAQSGKWLINVRYTGDENASNIPPYLKYTVYKNFGTPQEERLIKLVKLNTQIDKVTLDSFIYSKT